MKKKKTTPVEGTTELTDEELAQVSGGNQGTSDVVELNIQSVIHKGEVLRPAQIEIEEADKVGQADASAFYMGMGYKFIPPTLDD